MTDPNFLTRLVIGGKDYVVEINDIGTNPVEVIVNGVQVLVQKEQPQLPSLSAQALPISEPIFQDDGISHQLFAPLPGKVIEIFIHPGDKVEKGQVVLIIEAMKMKNSIRAVCSGSVGKVHISTGDQVSHKQLLAEFE